MPSDRTSAEFLGLQLSNSRALIRGVTLNGIRMQRTNYGVRVVGGWVLGGWAWVGGCVGGRAGGRALLGGRRLRCEAHERGKAWQAPALPSRPCRAAGRSPGCATPHRRPPTRWNALPPAHPGTHPRAPAPARSQATG